MNKFAVKKKKTVEVEEVPDAIKELINFLEEVHYKLTQAQYEIDHELDTHIEAVLDECGEDVHAEVYEIAGGLENGVVTDNDAGYISDAINQLKGEA
tara:strand:+ start:1067 stop:1357 length:291 start_codon:yes stop_codon:yes gene_type:complete